MDRKLFLITVCLSVFVVVSAGPQWSEKDVIDSFQKGLREMEDLLGSESEAKESREELEADVDDKNMSDPDQPSNPAPVEETDDDDEEDDFSSVLQNLPNIFNILRSPAMMPWWNGPNVCVERDVQMKTKENDTLVTRYGSFFTMGTAQFSSCKHLPNKYSCTTITSENGTTKTSTVSYQCCRGYRRNSRTSGCSKVESKSLVEMSEEAGSSKFGQMLKSADLRFDTENVTVLAPTDKAMIEFLQGEEGKASIFTNEVMASEQGGETQLVLRHMIPQFLTTDDIYNDKIVHNMLNNGSMRFNVFPGRRSSSVTVNCAKVNTSDKISTEGVLHSIDSVIPIPSASLIEVLKEQYPAFYKLLEDNEMVERLETKGPYTVLAISDEDLNKIEYSPKCISRILQHHILPHTVCSAAADQGRISALDLVDDWLRIERNDDGELLFDGTVKALSTDKVTTNGVLHRVDSFVVPQAAKKGSDLLRSTNHTKFLGLLERVGLIDALDNSDEVTLFVPSESGITSAEDNIMEMNDEDLTELLKYHFLPDIVTSGKLKNNEKLRTLLPEKNVTVSLVSSILGGLAGIGTRGLVQCAPLTRIDGDICNGIVHEIAYPITPPSNTLFDNIQTNKELEKFRKLLDGTKLEEELKSGSLGPVTVLALSDFALEKVGQGNYDILLKDKDLADQILRAHVLKGTVCCSGISSTAWPFISTEMTIGGGTLETNRRYRSNKVTFAGVEASECDIGATDGLMHILSGVVLPVGHKKTNKIIVRRPNSDIILTGF